MQRTCPHTPCAQINQYVLTLAMQSAHMQMHQRTHCQTVVGSAAILASSQSSGDSWQQGAC